MSGTQPHLARLCAAYDIPEVTGDKMLSKMEAVSYAAGETVYCQGVDDGFLYVVKEGTIRVTVRGAFGGEQDESGERTEVYVKTLQPGETSGFYSFLEKRGHGATLTCMTPSIVMRLSRELFEDLLRNDFELTRGLLKNLSIKLQGVRHNVFSRASSEVKESGCKLKIVFYDAKSFWRPVLTELLSKSEYGDRIEVIFKDVKMNSETVFLASGATAVCCFVNDTLDESVLRTLNHLGVGMVLMRCAGFNNLDLKTCDTLGISVARVPAYSPYAVAEHAISLAMTLNRKVHVAYNRVRDGNFTLEGLTGFDVHGKTVGIAGTGKIGQCFARIMKGFGCKLLYFDLYPNKDLVEELGGEYVSLERLLSESDIVSLHLPMNEGTKYIINERTLAMMKSSAFLINTSRGGLVDLRALINALKKGSIGGAGLDVIDNEGEYFFEDWSTRLIQNESLSLLCSFKNVVITSHQAFLTNEALSNICSQTLDNALEYDSGKRMSELTQSLNKNDRNLQPNQ